MFIAELLASVLFAILASTLSVYLLRLSGVRMATFWLFMLVLLATWAGGVWLRPMGPGVGGISLMSFVIAAALAVLLVLAVARRPTPHNRRETIAFLQQEQRKKEMQAVTTLSLNLLFYFLLILFTVAIVAHYIH